MKWRLKTFGSMGFSPLRKIFKKDPVKKNLIMNPPDLSGAIFVFGRIKSGKTTSLLSFAQIYHDHPNRKYKIFDLWGGSRNEHLYWTLPSNKKNYWDKTKKQLRLSKPGPKQYKVNLLYPVTSKLPEKLPNNSPFIHSKVFTIDFRDIKLEDISLVMGTISSRDESLWKDLMFESNKKTSIAMLLDKIEKKKANSYSIYRQFLYPLINEGLISDSTSNINIDISDEVKDQETISVLCLDFVDKEYKLFVLGYFLRCICDDLDRRHRKVVGIIREASEFFRVSDQTIVPDRLKVFKAYLSDWIRMGRRGLHLLIDSQSPAETRGIVEGQQDLTLLGRLPGEADRVSATEQLWRDGLITKKQRQMLGLLNPGQFLVSPSGKPSYLQYFLLPRSRYWEEHNGNFYNNVWKNEIDKWDISHNQIIEDMKEKVKKDKEEIIIKNEQEKAISKVKERIETVKIRSAKKYIENMPYKSPFENVEEISNDSDEIELETEQESEEEFVEKQESEIKPMVENKSIPQEVIEEPKEKPLKKPKPLILNKTKSTSNFDDFV